MAIISKLNMVAEVLDYLELYRLRDACIEAADYLSANREGRP